MQRSITAETYARSLACIGDFDTRDELYQVKAQTLLLQRRDCDVASPSLTQTLAGALPDARVSVLEGRSGWIYSGDVRTCTETILEFLSGDTGEGELHLDWVPNSGLTLRETEILRLLTGGLRSKEIASMLGISVHTVQRHIANIYGKTGTNGRAGAAVYAIRSGLV